MQTTNRYLNPKESANPDRLKFGLLFAGQSDVDDGGQLQSLWLRINHAIFARVCETCLHTSHSPEFAESVRKTKSVAELAKVISIRSSIPVDFLVPNFEYISALRDHCHEDELQLAPAEFQVGIGFLIGRWKERHDQRCTHWRSCVLEFVRSSDCVRLVHRNDRTHSVTRPKTDYVIRANLFVVD
jgi:hypothetical protein